MARLLFSHSYIYRLDPKQWRNRQPYPPLATLYAASLMRQRGHKVFLFDPALRCSTDQLSPLLSRHNPDFFILYEDSFNYLSKMCLTNMRQAAFQMIRKAKQQGCTVIVSGSDATDHSEKYIREGADFIILGEGEITLAELVRELSGSTRNIHGIPGLLFPENNSIRQTAKRIALKDLDVLPHPAWDLADIDSYKNIWKKNHGYFSLNLSTTRGCPFKCNWCAKPVYGNRYTSHSPAWVAEEAEKLMKDYGVSHFWVCDDIFGLKPGWVQTFRNEISKRALRFRYKIQSRVDLMLKEDTIDALAGSGLEEVWVGAESGSQKILDAMDKGTTVEQIRKATALLQMKKVKVCFFLQFGYPGEDKQDIHQTIAMVKELKPDNIGISVSYPLPGTGFYEKVKKDLKNKANWTDSDDLDMMFTGAYSPEFYRTLHRYVHKMFRREQHAAILSDFYRSKGEMISTKIRSSALFCYYYASSAFLKARLKKNERLS